MRHPILFVTGAAMSVLSFILPAQAGVYREFKAWMISCSNGATCTLSPAYTEEAPPVSVSLRRTGQPAAPVEFVVSWPKSNGGLPSNGMRLTLSIDGTTVADLDAGTLKSDSDSQTLVIDKPDIAATLLQAMRKGSVLTAAYTGEDPGKGLRLDGFSAALLHLDDVQDRIDRVDGLAKPGARPAPERSMLSDVLSLEAVPASIRDDFATDQAVCGGIEPQQFGRLGGFDVTIDETRIVVLPCGVGGAYNQPYALYVGFDDFLERTSFPDWSDGPGVMSTAYNLDFEFKTRTFTAFFKGRGIGDCGAWHVFDLTDGLGGTLRPRLKELRVKDDCDEKGGPETFPLVYPVKK